MNKTQIDFSAYTLFVPFLAIMLLCLNEIFGVSCADTCRVYSYFLQNVFLVSVCIIGALDVIFSIISGKHLSLSILNCVFCVYIFMRISMGGWAFILVGIPALITVPIQFILWYRLFREKKRKIPSWVWKVFLLIILIIVLFS